MEGKNETETEKHKKGKQENLREIKPSLIKQRTKLY
jgi:hypothetical protein